MVQLRLTSFAPDALSLLAKRRENSGTDCTMKKIQLTKGFCAKVDDEDFERVNSYKWAAMVQNPTKVYAWRETRVSEGKPTRTAYMHRFILGEKKGFEIDHINGDKLDNRKCNLRFCTSSQNSMNSGLRNDNVSGYKGVSYHRKNKMWVTQISTQNKITFVGYFHDVKEAARAYDKAARELFGEFARLNFPL